MKETSTSFPGTLYILEGEKYLEKEGREGRGEGRKGGREGKADSAVSHSSWLKCSPDISSRRESKHQHPLVGYLPESCYGKRGGSSLVPPPGAGV